jgi:hypothetical protein
MTRRSAMPSGQELRAWFDDELEARDPKPSLEACHRISHRLELVRNPSLADAKNKLDQEVAGAAAEVLKVLRKYEDARRRRKEFVGTPDEGDQTVAAREQLEQDAAPLVRVHNDAAWHPTGRAIAELIKQALQEAGYRGRLRSADRESVVAVVGAKVVSRVFNLKIAASGFASAMQQRPPRQKFAARFPQASDPKRTSLLRRVSPSGVPACGDTIPLAGGSNESARVHHAA